MWTNKGKGTEKSANEIYKIYQDFQKVMKSLRTTV